MTYSREPPNTALNATRVRQGRWGRPVFWVLVFSTLLAALGLFAAWTWKAPDLASTDPTAAEQQAAASAFQAPQPPPPDPD